MNNLSAKDVENAFSFLSEARKILFQQLHEPGTRSIALVEGVDKLGAAFELAENPDCLFHICPTCESIASENLNDGTFHCFSCDEVWQQQMD